MIIIIRCIRGNRRVVVGLAGTKNAVCGELLLCRQTAARARSHFISASLKRWPASLPEPRTHIGHRVGESVWVGIGKTVFTARPASQGFEKRKTVGALAFFNKATRGVSSSVAATGG